MIRVGPAVVSVPSSAESSRSKAEQPVQGVAVGGDGVGVGGRLQLLRWADQQLFQNQPCDFLHARPRFRRQRRELRLEPPQLGLPDRLEPLSERHDGRHGTARIEPAEELPDFLRDDLLRLGRFRPALRDVLLHDGLQVVDVIEEDLLEIARTGLDISRHGDIDDEQRPLPARLHRLRRRARAR